MSNAEEVLAVFSYWQQIMNHARARMDIKRANVIRDRLKDGYSVQDLEVAIEGCACSSWHMGQAENNKTVFDSITLILRDADHVERFMDLGEQGRKIIEQMRKNKERTVETPARIPPTEEEKARVRAMLKGALRRVA